MFNKDYYRILQVQPSASLTDIKRAYRILVLAFHPDKNNSQQAAAQFIEIQEAYTVLSDVSKRRKYDAARFARQRITRPIATTPQEVRAMSTELLQHIRNGNPDRINIDWLVQNIEAVLSVYHIQLLENNDDRIELKQLIANCLFCLQYVDYSNCMHLLNRLQNIKGLDEESSFLIQSFRKHYVNNYYWNRYKMLVVLLITLAFCLLLYLSR